MNADLQQVATAIVQMARDPYQADFAVENVRRVLESTIQKNSITHTHAVTSIAASLHTLTGVISVYLATGGLTLEQVQALTQQASQLYNQAQAHAKDPTVQG